MSSQPAEERVGESWKERDTASIFKGRAILLGVASVIIEPWLSVGLAALVDVEYLFQCTCDLAAIVKPWQL